MTVYILVGWDIEYREILGVYENIDTAKRLYEGWYIAKEDGRWTCLNQDGIQPWQVIK